MRKKSLKTSIRKYNGKYILAVEGNPPLGEQGMFCISSGRPFIEKLNAAAGASAIIAWEPARPGAACRPRDPIRRRQRLSTKSVTDKTYYQSTRRPPIPDVMSAIITYMVTFDRLPDVDRMGRPLMF